MYRFIKYGNFFQFANILVHDSYQPKLMLSNLILERLDKSFVQFKLMKFTISQQNNCRNHCLSSYPSAFNAYNKEESLQLSLYYKKINGKSP